jgi:2-polyprenyl-3-methyl-5-hydroxy-6-metoxy-1,4-benzoquinol methylase
LWAILSAPEKHHNQWKVEEFMVTGGPTIETVLRLLEELGLTVGRTRALDFGCGVGRLSQPLAEQFERVAGVDMRTR